MDLLAPQLVPTVRGNSNLKVLSRPAFNVAYVTIQSAKPPMNDIRVRRAVAYGLNRQLVVNSFYGGRGQVAHAFMPPSLPGYAKDVVKYSYNPTRARQLLREAGCGPPCKIQFWYPTGVSRPYMPDPKANFEAFKASLEASGFDVETTSMPWRPDYVKHVNEGTAGHLNLIGWTGDYADADNFLGTFFQGFSPQFQERNAALDRLLDRAESGHEPGSADRALQAGEQADHAEPAGRPVRAFDAGTRLPEAGAGLLHEPDRHRSVQDRLPGRTVGT